MPKTELRKEWERRISVFKASGQTQSKWCAANDLKIHQFKYWLKRIEDSNSTQKNSTQWTSVTIEEATEAADESLHVKIGQASIEVKPGFNPTLLADLVRTLKTLC
jgi:hypothetical protein